MNTIQQEHGNGRTWVRRRRDALNSKDQNVRFSVALAAAAAVAFLVANTIGIDASSSRWALLGAVVAFLSSWVTLLWTLSGLILSGVRESGASPPVMAGARKVAVGFEVILAAVGLALWVHALGIGG